jgi:hypothetical protein
MGTVDCHFQHIHLLRASGKTSIDSRRWENRCPLLMEGDAKSLEGWSMVALCATCHTYRELEVRVG